MQDKIKIIFLNILLYGAPLLAYSLLPFSTKMFGPFLLPFSTLGLIFDFLLLYILYLLFFKIETPIGQFRVYQIWQGAKKIYKYIFKDKLKSGLELSHNERVSLLFYLVKIFFTPVMVNFLIDNVRSFAGLIRKPGLFSLSPENIYSSYFYLAFYLFLVIDTLIFAFGYLAESKSLKNTVKSVEPTFLGWAVALMCYPPFNSLTADIFGWYSADFKDFGSITANLITGGASLLLFGVYVWATIALGFKASNLTNRGIVSGGPYKYIRHPAYISKNLSWWLMAIPAIKISGLAAVFSLLAWSFVYFLRALTEERHLSKDPDYVEYSKKVRHMFIPGIF